MRCLHIVTFSNIGVVVWLEMLYSVGMAEDIKKLNKYEVALNKELTAIMEAEKMKFPAFLSVFSKSVPDKGSDEYMKLLKKEQMKYRRSSLSMEEVFKMLEIAGWELLFILNDKPVKLKHFVTNIKGSNHRIRFTDFMIICEMFGVQMKWAKKVDRTCSKNLL